MAVHDVVKHDPAVERWNHMREDAYRHFRFTNKATWLALAGLVIVPSAIYTLASSEDNKWNWTAKRKGQSLYRIPPPSLEPTED
ncbi:hypothetical protein OF83DRAFT_1171722 [Amylostereum chailletii]|nr:hypothetical protein OF83DRAFT_1171722 [Amylostereum chailletii]